MTEDEQNDDEPLSGPANDTDGGASSDEEKGDDQTPNGDESGQETDESPSNTETDRSSGSDGHESHDSSRDSEEHEEANGSENKGGQTLAEVEALRERLVDTEARVDELETKLEDYQRRNKREHEELRKYTVEDLAAEMLEVKDMLGDAIEMEDFEEASERRLRMIEKQFEKVLTSGRIEPIEPERGEMYDDRYHRMTDRVAAKNHDRDEIVRVLATGYRTHDRVIRPARVEVAIGEG